MNQCKLKVMMQEMARLNIVIIGISELNWMALVEFNSDGIVSIVVSKSP